MFTWVHKATFLFHAGNDKTSRRKNLMLPSRKMYFFLPESFPVTAFARLIHNFVSWPWILGICVMGVTI